MSICVFYGTALGVTFSASESRRDERLVVW